jgi:signal transduction histidine kinase
MRETYSGSNETSGVETTEPREGVILAGSDFALEHADPTARALLGGETDEPRPPGWDQFRAVLEESASDAPAGRLGPIDVTIRLAERTVPLRASIVVTGPVPQRRYVLLVRERGELAALEDVFRLASQMRTLAALQRPLGHDIKAPLNAMVLNLDLLRSSVERSEAAEERERQMRYLDVLRQETARLASSIQGLLGQMKVSDRPRESVDLRRLLREVANVVGPVAGRLRVQVDVAVPGEPVTADVHRDRVRQALVNLALNGLEAMDAGGRLSLRLGCSEQLASAEITDTGPGLPEEARRRLFEPFHTTKPGHAGIGASVARMVALQHGGAVEIDNAAEGGVRALFRIPLRAGERSA